MKYALNLSEDYRVLSVTFEKYAPQDAIKVDELPEGNIADYKFINNEFIYEPIMAELVEEKPSQLDLIEAQVTYTAMMTDTLLEV